MSPTAALLEALNGSITSGNFADTKIYLFSHRNSEGDVCKPKALYANSAVLRSVPYFNDLFSGNYSETATKDLDDDVADEDAIAEHYDYDSDSDLEDAEDLRPTEESPQALLRGHPFDPFCFVSHESGGSESNNDGTAENEPQDTACSGGRVPALHDGRMKVGKVIRVQDVAFTTFQAFLFYLYTEHIEFAPFGSKANRRTRTAEITSLAPDHVARPSPKSIYRLADKYDVPVLKSVALEAIEEGLGRCDAVRETFSRFSSHYPEILRNHVENLASVLTEGDESGEVQDQLDERLQACAEGEIDHASEAFSSLWRILTNTGDGRITRGIRLDTRRVYPRAESPPLWIALIKSIRRGSFCDRRYLTKRDNSGEWRTPVYISSIVLGGAELILDTLIRDPRRSGADCSEDECDSDSDYEDTTEGTPVSTREDTEHSESEQEPKPEQAVTLSTGAFPTWRALFFFLYTGDVKFAPLKSQGSEARTQYMRENTRPGDPPLCSPKSICHLAGKLGLEYLEGTALEDVAAKTSMTNIVRETFSKSTARLPGVREMQCQLLISSSRNEGVTTATEEHIRGLAGGQAPHRYAALSLGFKMVVGEKRRSPSVGTDFPAGPTLQCSNPDCSQRGRPLFVRDIGEKTVCQICRWRLRCCVCGRFRKPDRPNCSGCKRLWN